MIDDSLVDEDYELWVLLHQAKDAASKARKTELSQYGIRYQRAAVLFIVQALGDEATLGAISRFLFREPHSVSDLLSRMAREGLVTKVKSLRGKNQVKISLTEKGWQAYHQSAKRDSIHKILSCLSEEERRVMRSALKKVRDEAVVQQARGLQPPFPRV